VILIGLLALHQNAGQVLAAQKAPSFHTASLLVNQPPTITSVNATTFTVSQLGSFTVTTTGSPTPAISTQDLLPSGLSFIDNGNGTATISGTPMPSRGGVYIIHILANNGIMPPAVQTFTITVMESLEIIGGNRTIFAPNQYGIFVIKTLGYPTPTLSAAGALPTGITFNDYGNGMAILSGTPSAGSSGDYPIILTASNGVTPNITQNFTFNISYAPWFTSPTHAYAKIGQTLTFTARANGSPAPSISLSVSEVCQRFLDKPNTDFSFIDNTNGTATLSVTPQDGNFYCEMTFTAHNTAGTDAVQNFLLWISNNPTITSDNNSTFHVGYAQSFQVQTTGSLITISEVGTLPTGITFDGHYLSGTAEPGSDGVYPILVIASSKTGQKDVQGFTLFVDQDSPPPPLTAPPVITSTNITTFFPGQVGTFTVTTTGSPKPNITRSGVTLPTGIFFVNNGDGTGTLSGTTLVAPGVYPLIFTASNGISPNAIQLFNLHVGQPPIITSPDVSTFVAGQSKTFTITTTGAPTPWISSNNNLPEGLNLVDNGNGTATLSGSAATRAKGTYHLVIFAYNGGNPDATQNITIYVFEPPTITKVNSVSDTGDGQITENERVFTSITQLLVTFTTEMKLSEVSNVSNYNLIRTDTSNITINNIVYDSHSRTAIISVNDGAALPPGAYSLTVKSNLHDTNGISLTTDFVRHFIVFHPAYIPLIQNGKAN
jgi:hypothetical protein